MRFLSLFRKPRIFYQGPRVRVGVASKIGVVQWAPHTRQYRRQQRRSNRGR